jgi:hypothetical protein
MLPRSTRTIVDLASLFGILWMWTAVYESFTRSGLWLILSRAVGGATTLPGEAALLAACVLAGWLVLAVWSWVAVIVTERVRAVRDFPAARVMR